MTNRAPKTRGSDDDRPPKPKSGVLSDKAANVIIAIVTTVWVVNVVAGMFSINGYQTDPGVSTIFTVVVGGAFVLRYKGRDE